MELTDIPRTPHSGVFCIYMSDEEPVNHVVNKKIYIEIDVSSMDGTVDGTHQLQPQLDSEMSIFIRSVVPKVIPSDVFGI